MDDHLKVVQQEFSKQSNDFNTYQEMFSKSQFMNEIVKNMNLKGKESALECAAGTCGFGRMIAPHVGHLTELDVTDEMLKIGMEAGEKEHLSNVDYLIGAVEKLPFKDNSFDLVFSRLAFHHFVDPAEDMAEMSRVLKPGGHFLVVDMEARKERCRDMADRIERARDPSHVRCLSEDEFNDLLDQFHLHQLWKKKAEIPVSVDSWMNLTLTPARMRKRILAVLQEDLDGGEETGFEPYKKEGRLYYDQHWLAMMAVKEEG